MVKNPPFPNNARSQFQSRRNKRVNFPSSFERFQDKYPHLMKAFESHNGAAVQAGLLEVKVKVLVEPGTAAVNYNQRAQ